MSVRGFELFHGAVLTKLVRTDRPLTLRLIETRPTDSWSTYRINDEVNVLLKHSVNPQARKREKGALVWQFVFSPDQMKQLAQAGTWAALVCGAPKLGTAEMDVCLLDPDRIAQLLDISKTNQQSLTVKRLPGKSLRVTSVRVGDDVVISRNRLDEWAVPGS